jgi:ribosomal protein L11 methylase PrmA
MPDITIHPASFRDPSGFVFQWNNTYYRQVNKSYANDYDMLMGSGLYQHLLDKKLVIPHTETDEIIADQETWYKTLKPYQVPMITYPYEWCFEQLKDAALLTIKIVKASLDYGMIIKDATPYNIQFVDGRPMFIDTLSFEKYDASKAWVAYRQFCNMFLFPLYLEHYLKTDIQKTLIVYPDGIPVDITSKLLPLKSRTSVGVWLHVYLQNTISRNSGSRKDEERFNKRKLLNLVSHLETTTLNLRSRNLTSVWKNYYDETIISKNYLHEKEKIFRKLIANLELKSALDLGANDGYFSKIIAEKGTQVIAVDNDSRSICGLYESKNKNILPLVMDVANPSPATGFANRERLNFFKRINTDAVVALALIHHLVIGRNISLHMLAEWFSNISNQLIIEFVPRDDEKVKQMLASRKDVFTNYTASAFESFFNRYFTIKHKEQVPGTTRTIYLMEKR